MGSILKNKTLLMALGGVLVAAIVWYGFLGGADPNAPLLTTEDVVATANEDSEVVRTLLTLRAVSLSGTIFSDPAFMNLQDFGRDIIPEPVGRLNPFAPIGAQTQRATSTTLLQNPPGTSGVLRPIPPTPVQ